MTGRARLKPWPRPGCLGEARRGPGFRRKSGPGLIHEDVLVCWCLLWVLKPENLKIGITVRGWRARVLADRASRKSRARMQRSGYRDKRPCVLELFFHPDERDASIGSGRLFLGDRRHAAQSPRQDATTMWCSAWCGCLKRGKRGQRQQQYRGRFMSKPLHAFKPSLCNSRHHSQWCLQSITSPRWSKQHLSRFTAFDHSAKLGVF